MIEFTHPGIWQNMITWKMHNLENDRKNTHWKMMKNTHTGNDRIYTPWKMVENAQHGN